MTNIWGFLLQTLSVSAVALVLLVIKRLLRDKVSPDVQYVFWLALLFRILVPVQAGEGILFPFPEFVELLKAKAERGLSSAYSGMYEPAGNGHILPVYAGAPQSVTDWLFVAYGIGVAVVLLGYALAYVSLRARIARAGADEAQQARVEAVAARYGLHTVRVRMTANVQTPFVCGALAPVLVLPEGQETDELVLLHELLHREHHDPAKTMLWCLLRALHWCNPFVWYAINRIENDLETCNDQRVLECIEADARRSYGKTLLAMAVERYARMPGTSSISNGRKNITRRIEAIARFKKYPKGVTFAFVCIAAVLASAAMQQQISAEDGAWQYPRQKDGLDYALAKSRVERCTTAAGALDTYAKGLLCKNGIYLAMASPLSKQAALEELMRDNVNEEAYYADIGITGKRELHLERWDGYRVCNFRAVEEAGLAHSWKQVPVSYEAALLFGVYGDFPQEGDGLPVSNARTLAVPVRTYRTPKEGWVVERVGEAVLLDAPFYTGWMDLSPLEPLRSYETACAYGTVQLDIYSIYEVEGNIVDAGGDISAYVGRRANPVPNPDAGFSRAYVWQSLVYDARGAKAGMPGEKVSVVCGRVPNGADSAFYPERFLTDEEDTVSPESYGWDSRRIDETSPRGVLTMGFGGVTGTEANGEFLTNYGVQIYWDDNLMGEFLLGEVRGAQVGDGGAGDQVFLN